jgi:acetyl esterase/lipase
MPRCCWFSFVIALCAAPLAADEVAWKRHAIDAGSEFPSCAVFDVNGDGRLDIFAGGWWYEAPTWKKHRVRDVEVIRGRFDDYSNLPLDVNGDGWTDVISVNYRSETIYWIEHPGEKLGQQDWKVHVIDKPGRSETGRLHDIDGDGLPDILPNGTNFAAWYRFQPAPRDDGGREPRWVKHALPLETAGHGLGWDDAGRHLLTPRGFWKRPDDLVAGRWLLEPFGDQDRARRLHADASVPILSRPLGEGRDQVVWGRGHRTGLYAAESRAVGGVRSLELTPIDTSWSQCHAPLWADIDGDGRLDLVAGKRYMGHEGNDPGEYDPLVIYWYRYDDQRRVWTRFPIQEFGPAGMDLDPKAIDIDGDGDIDLVAPSRNGLYLFENLRINRAGTKPDGPPAPPLKAYTDHARLLVFADAEGQLQPVTHPAEWAIRRWHILRSMEQVMGELPSSAARSPKYSWGAATEALPKYARLSVRLQSHGDDPAMLPATLLVPTELLADAKKLAPAMLCLHPTSLPHGKRIVTGQAAAPNRQYAHELAERGYVCICPDYPTMGEHPFDLKTTHTHYQSGTMKAIWDNVRCLDLLESLPYVDPDRIGVIGHSLGGHNGLFTACFDQRIKCAVTSCGFTPFHDYYGGKLAGWTQDRYMPRVRDTYASDPSRMPFDFYEVLGAIAPRPLFIHAPINDDNFDVEGVRKAVSAAERVYRLLGKPGALVARYPDVGHDFPPESREEVYDWLDAQLK